MYTVSADVQLESVPVWVCSSLSAFGSVVLHWYRRHVTVELPVRHFAGGRCAAQ